MDGFLHTHQVPLSLLEIQSLWEESGFKVHQFLMPYSSSASYLDELIPEKERTSSLKSLDKMNLLESMGEIQTNLVFLSHKKELSSQSPSFSIPKSNHQCILNPTLKQKIKRLKPLRFLSIFFKFQEYSPLLEEQIPLDSLSLKLLSLCIEPISYDKLKKSLKPQYSSEEVDQRIILLIKSLFIYII